MFSLEELVQKVIDLEKRVKELEDRAETGGLDGSGSEEKGPDSKGPDGTAQA